MSPVLRKKCWRLIIRRVNVWRVFRLQKPIRAVRKARATKREKAILSKLDVVANSCPPRATDSNTQEGS